MESDRALANTGPTSPTEPPSTNQPPPKQARRRVVGRRTASKNASTTANTSTNIEDSSSALAPTSGPPRRPRTLHSVPPEILHDPDLNQAIRSSLPSNYNFEIHKTVHRIRSTSVTRAALQFPEGLLLFAPIISDLLQGFCPALEDVVIMGDVTYGACCVDDFTARALGAELLVHYGHSCLVPLGEMKGGLGVMYVFVTVGVDFEHLQATISRNFTPGPRSRGGTGRLALVSTIQFNPTLHTLQQHLQSQGFDAFLPRSKPLSAGEILGCTAPTLTPSSSSAAAAAGNTTPSSTGRQEADTLLYVGDGRFHLESIMIASPSLRSRSYRYDPYSRRLTHETYAHAEMQQLRRDAVAAARATLSASPGKPGTTWGLILGTLGRQGNPHTLALIAAHLRRRGVEFVTLLLSEITPGKLALMEGGVGVWVQVACPRLSVDWGVHFGRPLLSAYEAVEALGVRPGRAGEKEGGRGGMEEQEQEQRRGWLDGRVGFEGDEEGGQAPEVYPMDYYAANGLGRVRAEDVPRANEIEVT